MTWQDVAQSVRPVLNEAASGSIPLVVRALDHECWRCKQAATSPVILHPDGHMDQYSVLDATSDFRLSYVHDLLVQVENPIAETIKPRYSKTRAEKYISHGCPQCDALFGEFPLQETITSVLANDTVQDLPVLLTVNRPLIEWWAVTCDRDNLWWDAN